MARQKSPPLPDMEEFIDKPPPQAVVDKGDEYVKALRLRMRNQEKEGVLRGELIELMKKHGVSGFEIEEGKKLVLENKGESVKIKKIADASAEE